MNRVKIISDAADLVSLLRAVDSPAKREVFTAFLKDWITRSEIEERFGDDGLAAISLFEKLKFVETKWEPSGVKVEKAYRSYYQSFHLNTTISFAEAQELLWVAIMPPDEYDPIEKKLLELLGPDGCFSGDVAKNMEVSNLTLKGLVKRSAKMEFKGHNIVPTNFI